MLWGSLHCRIMYRSSVIAGDKQVILTFGV